ncbi:MAG: ABC transporter ATP-binding protein, partial [Clostridiaceae bacterium]|nr:ABC transporter ATP-binding protein [Clostridiaceae bacterium]
MSTIITLDNVYRVFRMGQELIYAVNGVNLNIEEGEICCL